jgi:hypothetical protein
VHDLCVSSANKFTSKERDAETGLDFFLARYYSGAQLTFPQNPFIRAYDNFL